MINWQHLLFIFNKNNPIFLEILWPVRIRKGAQESRKEENEILIR